MQDIIDITLRGRSFKVNAAPQRAFWDKMTSGAWEPETLDWLDGALDAQGPEAVFFDIGGWIGPLALYAADRAAQVITVEADPVALENLRENIALNPDLAPKITVIDKVLYPKEGKARFGANRGKGGKSMSSVAHDVMSAAWELPTITPEALMAQAPEGAPLIVKIDIEAGEYGLAGRLAPLLRRKGAISRISLHPHFYLGQRQGAALMRRRLALYQETWRIFRPLRGLKITPPEGKHAPSALQWALVRRGLPPGALWGDWEFRA